MDCVDSAQVANLASHVVCIVQPTDWRIYITPALVALSIFIAILAILNTRAVARQKATLDLIEKTESTEHYRKLNDAFSELRRGAGFGHLHDPADDDTKVARQAVADYLNHYELVSIGILENILDQKIYRAWMEGPFVRDWNAAADFVQRERWKQRDDGSWAYYHKHFEHYQTLSTRWSGDARRLNSKTGGPPAPQEAGGPGAEPLPTSSADQRVEADDVGQEPEAKG